MDMYAATHTTQALDGIQVLCMKNAAAMPANYEQSHAELPTNLLLATNGID